MKVGFIGVGNMGVGIARNLLKAGHELTVYNRTRGRAEQFSPDARIAERPADAARQTEVVITMLSDDRALEDVVFASGGILEALAPDAIHVSMSTISVAMSRRLANAHAAQKQHYVAAPVFGRPDAAAAAKLFVVAAGPPNQVDRCRPIFDAIGQRTFIAGDEAAQANVVKICGNFLITAVIESLAESFALIRKSAIDAKQFLEIMTGSLFGAPIYKNYGALVASEQFEEAGFKLKLGLKDNRLVLAAAQDAAVPMPLASLIGDRFIAAIAQGMSDHDWSAIAEVTYRDAGLSPR